MGAILRLPRRWGLKFKIPIINEKPESVTTRRRPDVFIDPAMATAVTVDGPNANTGGHAKEKAPAAAGACEISSIGMD